MFHVFISDYNVVYLVSDGISSGSAICACDLCLVRSSSCHLPKYCGCVKLYTIERFLY